MAVLLLAEDPSLKPFKSHQKSVWRLKRIEDVLTIVVVTGCCYEIYVKAIMREEARKQAKGVHDGRVRFFSISFKSTGSIDRACRVLCFSRCRISWKKKSAIFRHLNPKMTLIDSDRFLVSNNSC